MRPRCAITFIAATHLFHPPVNQCDAEPAATVDGYRGIWYSNQPTGDEGRTWNKIKQLTHNSRFNHTYAWRPVDAAPRFYVLWADGNPRERTESNLYFTDRDGSHVWRLPTKMADEIDAPEIAW